jgi:fructokinase
LHRVRIGIDLGGTKIEGLAMDSDGRTLLRMRVPAPKGSYDATLRAIADLVQSIEGQTGRRGTVGVGIPGTVSKTTGRIKNSNSTWLNGTTMAVDLPERLGRPVRFANDANCFALSEATDGAAAGADVVFGVIIGTGTGGGLVVGGRVLAGVNGIAGEWGHNPLPWPRSDEWPGPPCYCGRQGCIETFLSGPGIRGEFGRIARRSLDVGEIVRLAADGDATAEACLVRYDDRMARALASVINLADPDVIVLGGGLSNVERLYTSVPARWSSYVFSDSVATRLIRAQHGDSSGVRGAAWLWNGVEKEE